MKAAFPKIPAFSPPIPTKTGTAPVHVMGFFSSFAGATSGLCHPKIFLGSKITQLASRESFDLKQSIRGGEPFGGLPQAPSVASKAGYVISLVVTHYSGRYVGSDKLAPHEDFQSSRRTGTMCY